MTHLRWQPTPHDIENSNLTAFMRWLAAKPGEGSSFGDYGALWRWSVEQPEAFWAAFAEYCGLASLQNYPVLQGAMPKARWFEGATVNYAAEAKARSKRDGVAIYFQSEHRPLEAITWEALWAKVDAFGLWLRDQGVQRGDRVVGYLPNIPEATIAMFATVAIGAVWSSASPDFGLGSVQERFGQIEPKVLVAVDGYRYGGKAFDKMDVVHALQASMPSVERVVLIPYLEEFTIDDLGLTIGEPANAPQSSIVNRQSSIEWWSVATAPQPDRELVFEAVPFDHPLWVLYSSGTTGLPKAIVHGHGGMLLEHLKYALFHNDVKPGERFFWYTTTGWMMWNFLNATLLAGATIVLYDGSPNYPNLNVLWDLAKAVDIRHFGTSAAFILACMKAEIRLPEGYLPQLRSIGSTGSPLPPEGFAWVYEHVKPDVWLSSMSGGTDICTAWVGGNPLLPVWEGEIQCRCLGCAMEAWDEAGNSLLDAVGEMIVTKPMPCMPIYFWNDAEDKKYRASYFEDYPGVWRHGDWVRITERDTVVILGRSDATLNRHGIRIGTSEIYRSVEKLTSIKDSLIVNLEYPDGTSIMPLFVVLAEGATLTDALKRDIAQVLRQDFSPRHVPDEVFLVPDIPYTISGKKMELPIKKILMGGALENVVNLDAVRNPDAVRWFAEVGKAQFRQ